MYPLKQSRSNYMGTYYNEQMSNPAAIPLLAAREYAPRYKIQSRNLLMRSP